MFTTLATSRVFDRRQIGAANPVYPFPIRNHQRPEGAIDAPRAREVLVCRWRQSSVTGKLESAWGTERITAPPIPAPGSIAALARPPSAVAPGQVHSKKGLCVRLDRVAEWLRPWLGGIRATQFW
jgi:hypothetical protein